MKFDPKSLFRQLGDVSLGAAKSLESERAVSFVKVLISSMDKTIKAIDEYLKKTKDRLQVGYEIAKDKSKTFRDLAKSKLTEVKDKGLIATAKKTAQDTAGKFKAIFDSDAEKANGPPNKETVLDGIKSFVNRKLNAESLTDKDKTSILYSVIDKVKGRFKSGMSQDQTDSPIMQDILGKINEKLNSIKDAVDTDAPTPDKKRSRFMDSFAKQRERMAARRKEVDEEKQGAKVKDKAKSKGPLGMIISAITALGGVFTGGIGKLMAFLPKLMLKGMGKLLTRVIPSIVGAIAPGLASAVGTVVGGAATAVGGAALSATGTVAGAAVGAILSPIGLGVIAVGLTLFTGYKLYKYLNRNDLGGGLAGKLTKLRMLTYGYNDSIKEHYNKVLDMDMLTKDYVTVKDGKAVYKKFDEKFKKSILEIFSIARTDKTKYELLNTWFIKRYIPAHASFMNAYYAAGGKTYLDDLDKLNHEQMFKFMVNYRVSVDIYDQKSIPVFESPLSTVSKEDVDALIVEITKHAKESIDGDKDKKAGVPTKKPTIYEQKKDYNQAGIDASDKKFTRPKESVVTAQSLPDPSDRKFLKGKEPLTDNEEGEKPPPASEESPTKQEKPLQNTVDKVAKAPGPLRVGDGDLLGIKSRVPIEKIQNLDPDMLSLFAGMTKEYNMLTGKSITVNEASRTYQDQQALKASKGEAAAKPGTSVHEYGIGVDISSLDADILDKMGLMRKYGFTRPIGGETWHIEPAGVALNPTASKADPQERTENILSSPGRGGGGLGASRSLPSSMKYKRDMALQKTLFNSGESIESPVNIEDIKKDQAIATGPIVDSKPVKNTSSAASMNDPTKMLQVKQEGLDIPKESKQAQGPQLTKTVYRPPVQDKKIYSDYSEGEKPPKETTDKTEYQNNANLGPKEAILKASEVVGVDYNKLLTFAKLESSLKSGVQSSASTATGLFQIVGRTWEMLLKKYGPKYNIPADAQPTNAYYNSVLGACYAKENMSRMQKFEDSGIRQDILVYLAHHFGPEGGERIVRAYMKTPDSPIQMHVSQSAYTSNIQVLANKTVRQYIDSLVTKFNKAGATSYDNKYKAPTSNEIKKPSINKTESVGILTSQSDTGDKVYGDDYDYNTGADRSSNPTPVEQAANKLNYPVRFNKQGIQPPRPDIKVNKNTSKANLDLSGINGVFSNISKGITDTTSILNKGMNPASGMNDSKQPVPQQSSTGMNLDKTESLLMNMDDTLIQIKVILQSINNKAAMTSIQTDTAEAKVPDKQPVQPKEPIRAPNYNEPSTQGVSMSRRSVLT